MYIWFPYNNQTTLNLQYKKPALNEPPVLSKIEGSKEAPLNNFAFFLVSLCTYAPPFGRTYSVTSDLSNTESL